MLFDYLVNDRDFVISFHLHGFFGKCYHCGRNLIVILDGGKFRDLFFMLAIWHADIKDQFCTFTPHSKAVNQVLRFCQHFHHLWILPFI
jgi:hypothetical protein